MAFEKNLWLWLREGTKHLKSLHLCRVENSASLGYPDVEGCWEGLSFHIELKGATRPKKPTTPVRVKWQPGQKTWIKKRWECGGNVYVLLRVGKGADLKIYLIRGEFVDYVGEVTEEKLHDLGSLAHQPKPIDILDAIFDGETL